MADTKKLFEFEYIESLEDNYEGGKKTFFITQAEIGGQTQVRISNNGIGEFRQIINIPPQVVPSLVAELIRGWK